MEKYTELLSEIKSQIPVGESFDLLERKLEIAGRDAEMFFVDGLVDGSMMQRVLFSLFSLKTEQLETAETMEQFLQSFVYSLHENFSSVFWAENYVKAQIMNAVRA